MSTNWDQQYHDEETPWDKGAPSPPLLEWLDLHRGLAAGRVFVPGCGLGHDVRAIASCPEVDKVMGLDFSPRAIELARAYPASEAVTYEAGDLFALAEHHRGTYDWVWEHTCFCAIDPDLRNAYVEAVDSALRPGGSFLGVFFLHPYDEDHRPGEGPPHGATLDELLDRFTEAGNFTLAESYLPTRSYPGREGLEWILRFIRS